MTKDEFTKLVLEYLEKDADCLAMNGNFRVLYDYMVSKLVFARWCDKKVKEAFREKQL